MDNKNYENSSTKLQDYEIEISNHLNIFFNWFEKSKLSKKQKLLNSNNCSKPLVTNASIYSLWFFGRFKSSIFKFLDSTRQIILKKLKK